MGITYGDHLIDSGYYEPTEEQEREMVERGCTTRNMEVSVFEQMHSPPEYRWAACYGQYDTGSVCGLGATPEAAKADLIANYDEPAGFTTHNSVARPQRTEDQVLLDEALFVLHEMATENTGWRSFFRRWYFSDEPLRNDASNIVRRAGYQIKRPEHTRLVGEGRWP